jgi:3-keto-5-aminohexanoate cleavage enzyme
MSLNDKIVVSAAITGVLTNPEKFNVPVTPEQMADAAEQAYNAGATVVHCHFRSPEKGLSWLPTWDLEHVGDILSAIKDRVPEMIINMSTGVVGDDVSGPLACLEAFKPEMAALNAGSLNYLKTRKDGSWAWPPVHFDNPIEKIKKFLDVMLANDIVPEFECFDTGITRSVGMFQSVGMFEGTPHISLVMGVESGMPARADLLPILKDELPQGAIWQTIATGPGREKVWDVHRKAAELGGNVRTGLEDTFYLPNGERAQNNGHLVEALVRIVTEVGREVASASETREILGLRQNGKR